MLKNFGKCFGPSTSKFSTQMPKLFIIKICFTIKVNSVCGAGRDSRNLCHKFSSQGPALKILGLRVASPKFQGPSSGVLGVRVLYLRVSDCRVLGLRVLHSGSQVSGSKVSRSRAKKESAYVSFCNKLLAPHPTHNKFSLFLKLLGNKNKL